MAGATLTESERLFERFCELEKIPCVRIEASSAQGVRSPDYDIVLGGNAIVAEVTQCDPTGEELRLEEQLETRGYTDVFGGEPGARLRNKLADKIPQLRARTRNLIPGVVVVYNAVRITDHHTHPYSVLTAMHGLEAVVLQRSGTADGSFHSAGYSIGKKRRVSADHNTTLSATAIISRDPDFELALCVYHNRHAKHPLSPSLLRSVRVKHFALCEPAPGDRTGWQDVSERHA